MDPLNSPVPPSKKTRVQAGIMHFFGPVTQMWPVNMFLISPIQLTLDRFLSIQNVATLTLQLLRYTSFPVVML